MQVWLVTNIFNGELNLLATTMTVYAGEKIDHRIIEYGGDEYRLMPAVGTLYKIMPKYNLLPLVCLGDIGVGSSVGMHNEAKQLLVSAAPEIKEVADPKVTEAFIDLVSEHLIAGDLMSFAADRLAKKAPILALRAFLLGVIA